MSPAALEGLWAFAAETDRLTDALVAAALNRESLLDAVELGRVPLGVTERGLRRGLRALPPATQSIRVGWPAHFGPCDWLVQALYSRSKDGATPLLKLELRAAGAAVPVVLVGCRLDLRNGLGRDTTLMDLSLIHI